jgi:hypothetical protein
MKRYFYSDGINQFGPYTIEELKEKSISPDTLIWYQGLDEWMPASDAPLLNEELGFVKKPMIEISDEDLQKEKDQMIRSEGRVEIHSDFQQGMPRSWLVESILVTIFCCQPIGIVGIIFAAQVEPKFNKGDFDGAKKASEMAGIFTKVGFFLSLAFIVFYFLLVLSSLF